jgi:hypothetical protein
MNVVGAVFHALYAEAPDTIHIGTWHQYHFVAQPAMI